MRSRLTRLLSSNTKKLRTDQLLAREYVRAVSGLEGVTAVNVGGSRSPKSAEDSHEESDWDFHVMWQTPMELPQPIQWGLHGEAHGFLTARKKDVQVWPEDKYGLLECTH